MSFQDYFPIWDQLQIQQQQRLLDSLSFQKVSRGTILHDGSTAGTGLYLIRAGQLRAYVFSDEGREITIYRLFERDMCLFSATCIIQTIANHLGSHREVITRMLRYFQSQGLVKVSRGMVTLLDTARLEELRDDPSRSAHR